MCANFEPVLRPERLQQYFGVGPVEGCPPETWPGYAAPFVSPSADPTQSGVREAFVGRYGLVPSWAKDLNIGRRTYNARSETVAQLPSFRDAWRSGQRCVVPLEAFYEPNWESGVGVRWRIQSTDAIPLGVAGLWSQWHAPNGVSVLSFTMLTVNADAHPLMRRFHRPDDEKRMVVILPESDYDQWLNGSEGDARSLLRSYPAELLTAAPAPLPRRNPRTRRDAQMGMLFPPDSD